MKSFRASSLRLILWLAGCVSFTLPVQAITFTTDTTISFDYTNYDGEDIVVTNCTLTVDGMHSFASLQVLNGGKVTHSFATNGLLENLSTIIGEQHVLYDANAAALNFSNAVIASLVVNDVSGSVTYSNGVDYVAVLGDNSLATIARTPGSAITNGETVRVNYQFDIPVPTGLALMLAGDVFIAQGGAINATGKGYGGSFGSGPGQSAGGPANGGGGGGHGGYGGLSFSNVVGGIAYGAAHQPVDKGSGGGAGSTGMGANGGGDIRLLVGGTLRVDGAITASGLNATNSRAGGGAGGSIWLTAVNFSGTGAIVANGGAGEPSRGGGGGGGRIAIYSETNQFSGSLLALGGLGAMPGGAGTIYIKGTDQPVGLTLVDNGGRSGANTLLAAAEPFDLTVRGAAKMTAVSAQTVRNLVIASNAWFVVTNQALTITGSATIDSGGGILADGTGLPSGQGTGLGGTSSSGTFGVTGGGGGHGGFGAASAAGGNGGNSHGSLLQPMVLGSGGGRGNGNAPANYGGAGGGAVRVTITGTLLLNGLISANGTDGAAPHSGGGSGGSVFLTVGTLTGTGRISSKGGAGNGVGGGGGGGRIAVYYISNVFSGTLTARGNDGGTVRGGAGTIFTKANNQSAGALIVDNGGAVGTNTTFGSYSTFTADLTLTGGASLPWPSGSPFTIRTLHMGLNTWLGITNYSRQITITIQSNATIQAGAVIAADGGGFQGGQGTGAGGTATSSTFGSTGGGGGFGGLGGTTLGGARGGSTYGSSLSSPADVGSGGGNATPNAGGAGGGSIRLNVTGTLLLDGWISANGQDARGLNCGGGSGGSLWLTAGKLIGSGRLTANGGAGNTYGAGGAGGRIAVAYFTNLFSGMISAFGGPGGGGIWGGAGTIYSGRNAQWPPGLVVIDNGGHDGTTPLAAGGVDLVVTGRATVVTSSSATLYNLFIASNSFMVATSATSLTLTINSNATIQTGGVLSADGMGFPGGTGTGAGKTWTSTPFGITGSGAGYGGVGGNSAGGAIGGAAYGTSMSQPTDRGSGGGSATTGAGGAGGGALRLNVTRTLLLDGSISANGRDATNFNSGGGSGGSVWLTAGTLAGSGRITSNGGAGGNYGGGGGGGRIAIGYGTNSFYGGLAAYGGGGNAWGGAGSVYLKASNQPVAQVLVDNGGHGGTNTLFSDSGTIDLTVQGGGVLSRSGTTHSFRNLVVGSNSWVLLTNQVVTATNINVEAGGGIIADGAGYGPSQGPGAGRSSQSGTGSGGGHGGYGASGGTAAGGNGYDTAATPIAMGSGGGGFGSGAGGGVIRMQVTGRLQVDGRVAANGMAGQSSNSGGGSGGSIWLTVGELSGTGLVSADGGAGNGLGGGGGGGGRIAAHYSSNTFAGSMRAFGGASGWTNTSRFGGAGTVYWKARNLNDSGLLLADNGGNAGTNTLLLDTTDLDLTIRGGAALVPGNSPYIHNLLIASNGWLVLSSQSVDLVRGTATIQAGGGIIADRTGFAGGQGLGAGSNRLSPIYGYTGGGGGYGGLGAPSDGDADGGHAYGSAPLFGTSNQDLRGSGGGGNAMNSAGAGGGLVRLSALALIVDGRISADGGDGVYQHGGGGSGGGIRLDVDTISGSGLISANGGDGNGVGGGGGGGRIAITCLTNHFAGTMRAWGGLGGGGAAGAGTVYLKTNPVQIARVLVDNGGWAGLSTPLLNLPNLGLSLTVKGGGVVEPYVSYLVLNDLVVDTFGTFTSATGQTNLDLIVYDNATIEAGGTVSVDGKGFTQASGPGAGWSVDEFGSGAGHGGFGGASVTAFGGPTYGSFAQPVERGSGGGFGFGPLYGGSEGGGAIRLNVGGTLTVNGRLGANGNAGLQDSSGGGSGGSVWVTTGAFAGNGEVTAQGGAGEWFGGGGGGGGRIAIYYRTSSPTNRFTGEFSAFGGEGEYWGEDGTVFLSSGVAPLQVVSQTPSGVVSNNVNRVDLFFNAPVRPGSFSGDDLTLETPTRTLAGTNFPVLSSSPAHFYILLPSLTEVGNYTICVGPAIEDLYRRPMTQVYTGAFTVVLPMVQGKVTDADGLPVPGVLLQPSAGVSPTLTDGNGHYALGFEPGSSFTVRPAKTGLMFVPGSLSYANVTATLTNQDFLAVDTIAPPIQTGVQGTNFVLGWHGYSGVSYQLLYSTNLVNWLPYGGTMIGSNASIQVPVPFEGEPMQFFRVQANN